MFGVAHFCDVFGIHTRQDRHGEELQVVALSLDGLFNDASGTVDRKKCYPYLRSALDGLANCLWNVVVLVVQENSLALLEKAVNKFFCTLGHLKYEPDFEEVNHTFKSGHQYAGGADIL